MPIAPSNIITNEASSMSETDSITGWQVKIPGFGKLTATDGVEYGADSPAIQALVGKAAKAFAGIARLGLSDLDNTSGISAESDVTPESLAIDLKVPSSLNLKGRLWAEGHARVPKKSPTVAKGFTVNRVIVGIHGEAFGIGAEALVAFDPIANAKGKTKPLSIQKVANLANSKNSSKLAHFLTPTAFYTNNPTALEVGLGIDPTLFSMTRSDVLTNAAAEAAFPDNWSTTGFFA